MMGIAQFVRYFKPSEGLTRDQVMEWVIDTMGKYLVYCAMQRLLDEIDHEVDLMYTDTIGGE